MVTLELEYLREIGRITEGPATVLPELHSRLGLVICDRDYTKIAQSAWAQNWTRDPFDRLIVAQAALGQNLLVTKDATILANYPNAIWSDSSHYYEYDVLRTA